MVPYINEPDLENKESNPVPYMNRYRVTYPNGIVRIHLANSQEELRKSLKAIGVGNSKFRKVN